MRSVSRLSSFLHLCIEMNLSTICTEISFKCDHVPSSVIPICKVCPSTLLHSPEYWNVCSKQPLSHSGAWRRHHRTNLTTSTRDRDKDTRTELYFAMWTFDPSQIEILASRWQIIFTLSSMWLMSSELHRRQMENASISSHDACLSHTWTRYELD